MDLPVSPDLLRGLQSYLTVVTTFYFFSIPLIISSTSVSIGKTNNLAIPATPPMINATTKIKMSSMMFS